MSTSDICHAQATAASGVAKLIGEISIALEEHQVEPHYLAIELTESTILKNADLAIDTLREFIASLS